MFRKVSLIALALFVVISLFLSAIYCAFPWSLAGVCPAPASVGR